MTTLQDVLQRSFSVSEAASRLQEALMRLTKSSLSPVTASEWVEKMIKRHY